MKKITVLFLSLFLFNTIIYGQMILKTEEQKQSYAVGINIGKSLKDQDIPLNMDAFIAGVKTVYGLEKHSMTTIEIQDALSTLSAALQQKRADQNLKAGKLNEEAGKKYLAENKKKKGVITTDSGLQYKIIKKGSGPKPKATDSVTVHYTGRLLDGDVFDSSHQRGEPATFPLNRVIKGWTEVLQLMSVGTTVEATIPAEIAYGVNAPASIGPNQVLIFEIELLGIEK